MKKSPIIVGRIVGVLVGMALAMPAVAQYRHERAMEHGEPSLFLMGTLLTLAACGAAYVT